MAELAKQILVIEKGTTTARLLNDNLALFPGYQVFTANTAAQALELLEVFRFDLVNLDLPLSDMDATQFLAKLADQNINSPVVVTLDSTSKVDLKVNPNVEVVVKDSLSPAQHLKLLQDNLEFYRKRIEQSEDLIEEAQNKLKASSTLVEQSGQQIETTRAMLEQFLERVADKVKGTLPPTLKVAPPVQKRTLTILVASDDMLDRRWFNQVLKSILRHRVILASSVGEALRIIREVKPDMVFTDLTFDWEGKDGLYLAREIKKRYPETFVVIVDGHTKSGSESIDLVLERPLSSRRIKAVVSTYLSTSSKLQDTEP